MKPVTFIWLKTDETCLWLFCSDAHQIYSHLLSDVNQRKGSARIRSKLIRGEKLRPLKKSRGWKNALEYSTPLTEIQSSAPNRFICLQSDSYRYFYANKKRRSHYSDRSIAVDFGRVDLDRASIAATRSIFPSDLAIQPGIFLPSGNLILKFGISIDFCSSLFVIPKQSGKLINVLN